LKAIFEAAWARQPEAVGHPARVEASLATSRAAQALTPEPAALELTAKTDQWSRNLGAAEREWGIVAPLWLPGERHRAHELAQAERAALENQQHASRLRIAGEVREAFWAYARTRADHELAATRLDYAQQLSKDVARRVRAGDLARADQHQAEGAVARAQAAIAQSNAALILAREQLKLLAGVMLEPADLEPEAEPGSTPEPTHAALAALQSRAEVASRSAALAATRKRSHPELTLATSRDRGARDEAWDNKLVIGVRIPFGGAKHDAAIAQAKAEAVETAAELALQRERITAHADIARARVEAQRSAWQAAQRRAEWARETRGFFEKSFALGQTDLPTRLRIDTEAIEAEREAALSGIDFAAAISALRQAHGLLP
jgi:cobalt-zinc-cadmium efflux system outer membrane protein